MAAIASCRLEVRVLANSRRILGDWQTPGDFACHCVRELVRLFPNFVPSTIFEPTCGRGSFLSACVNTFGDSQLYGIELQREHVEWARTDIPEATIICGDVFTESSRILSSSKSPLLIVGNPPWVHTDTLSANNAKIDSRRFGSKAFLNGLDAIIGNGNADIAELIFEHLWSETVDIERVFALLLKRSTARSIVQSLTADSEHPEMTICEFDAKPIFGIDASACLLIVSVLEQRGAGKIFLCNLDDTAKRSEVSFENGIIIRARATISLLRDGKPENIVWRQGVKHDCANIMELARTADGYVNKLGESVAVEESALYPLCKSSDLLHCPGTVLGDTKRAMPIWQKCLSDDPELVLREYPSLLRYIQAHADMFDKRRSKIYADRPRFSIFGIGEYSFSEYKIAISCFSKEPRFVLCEPQGGKPIVFDDTCYFLPFDDRMFAICCFIVLRSEAVSGFFDSVADETSKRVFSKKVLSLLDIANAARLVDERQRKEIADRNGLPVPSDEKWARFLELVC